MRNQLIILLLLFSSFSVSAVDLFDSDSAAMATMKLRQSLIGTWHNKYAQEDGGYKEEYFTVSKDGTFRLRFLTSNSTGGLLESYAITGIWGVAEDILFTTNLKYEYRNSVEYPAYLGDAHEFNAYRILEINDSFQRYHPLGKDKPANLNRLAEDPCKSTQGIKASCGNQDRIFLPSGSNNGSSISLAE